MSDSPHHRLADAAAIRERLIERDQQLRQLVGPAIDLDRLEAAFLCRAELRQRVERYSRAGMQVSPHQFRRG